MLLGVLVAKIQNPSFTEETLMALDDLPLMYGIAEAAKESGMTASVFVKRAIGRFIDNATDEDWLTLIGLMTGVDNPRQVLLRRILIGALSKPALCF